MRKAAWVLVVLAHCAKIPNAAEETLARSVATEAMPPGLEEAEAASAASFPSTSGFARSAEEESLGRWNAALTALDGLSHAQGDSYLAHLRRGWILYHLGRHVDAIAAYRRALAAEPASIEARVGLLLPELAAQRWREAEETAREALRLDGANYLASVRLAFALYEEGRFAEAEEIYGRLLTMYPSELDARAGLGWCLLRLGRRDEAKGRFFEVLEVAPRNTLALDGVRAAREGG